ncbi:MAG: hypothetical protein GM46_8305 [actinobacterium acAcidi]|nr:MAG: hypothetical protein GM46_8305 [actinobacterium acAcidi]
MARSVKIARSAAPAKVAPTRKKVTTRTAQQRRVQGSPKVRAVPQAAVSTRSRRLVIAGLFVSFLAIAMMMLVVVFQTRIAETQLNIDEIESQIAAERDRYDALRLERSSLREPSRLVSEATAMGMVPGNGTDFISVDPLTVAQVLVSTGGVDPELLAVSHDPLVNYGAVKSTIGDRP